MRPTRFLVSGWPLRSLIYLTGGALIGFATIVATLFLLAAGVVLSVVVVGVGGYLATVLSGVAVGRLERWRMRPARHQKARRPHGERLERVPDWHGP